MIWRMAGFGTAFVILFGILIAFPEIDLWTSGLFYRTPDGFYLGGWMPFAAIRAALPVIVVALVGLLATLLVATLFRKEVLCGIDRRAALFLLLSLALGPGLTVNTIFKDHWGRARPAQIVEFGGTRRFSPPFVPSDQCSRNCSFPAGDPALGFYLFSAAFLVSVPRRRPVAASAATLGAALGLIRLAQGGHYLSDVLASGFLVYSVSWALHRVLVVEDGARAALAALQHPSRGLKRALWLTLAALLGFGLSYFFLDEAVAFFFRQADPILRRVFAAITRLGEGIVYFVPLGIAIAWGLWAKRDAVVTRAGFVFAALAIPGLLADIAKPVFARARPSLLFEDGIFGFTWSGAHADRWSFPSGHAITVTALAVSLYAIYPRLWPVYATLALLVAASRIVIDAHYLSDVIAGAYFGFVAAWALAAALEQRGIVIALPRAAGDQG